MADMHEIDYKIFGDDLQFVEVELDPNEATVAEAGGMMYMDDGIEMETIFGDGSKQAQGGLLGALMGAGKRLLTGESLFMTVFLNRSSQKKRVAFGAPYPGKIVPIHLAEIGGELIAQKDSFLAAAKGVSIGIAFQRKLGVGLFGGEGFIMQRLQGDGWAFVHAGGTLLERTLAPGEIIRVDTGCIVGVSAVGQLRHPVRRQDQVGALRRGGSVLRDADGPRPHLAAVAAAQPDGEPHHRRGSRPWPRWTRRGLGPRRPRRAARRRQQLKASIAQQMPQRLQRFHAVAHHLDDHHHRHGEQHARDSPRPAPEQQAHEDRDLIHR